MSRGGVGDVNAVGVEACFIDDGLFERYRYARGPAGETPVHVHDQYQFCLSLDMAGLYIRPAGPIRLGPGELTVIHPGEAHGARDPSDRLSRARYLVTYLPVGAVRAAAGEVGRRGSDEPHFGQTVLPGEDLAQLFAALHASVEAPTDVLAHDVLRLDLLATALRRYARVPPRDTRAAFPSRPLRAARDFLQEHHAEAVPLRRLAEVAGYSPFHLCRAFREAFGVPPHRYQLLVRIGHAKRLLASGRHIQDVASLTGFADPSHFGRHFLRIVGFPPTRYRVRVATERP